MGKASYPSHPPVVMVVILISWLYERKSPVVARHVTRQADQHLQWDKQFQWCKTSSNKQTNKKKISSHFSKRGVNVKEEGPVDVVAAHLPKVCLIPAETHPFVDKILFIHPPPLAPSSQFQSKH